MGQQNAPVLTNPKGISAKRNNPNGNDWIGPVQADSDGAIYATQLKDLGGIAGGVETFNTRTGAVVLSEADVSVALGGPPGTTTAVAGAATLNKYAGAVTSEALVAATTYTLTLTDSIILAGSIVLANVIESTGAANPIIHSVTVSAGQVVIVVSMASLTGTLLFNFIVAN